MGANDIRKQALQSAMLAAGISPRQLARLSGFQSHQVAEAVAGAAKVSEYAYGALMKHINEYHASQRKE